MSTPQKVPSLDSSPAAAACPECGQHLLLCKSCNAPIEKISKVFALVFIALTLLGIALLASYIAAYVLIARDPSLLTPYLGTNPPNTWQTASMGEMFSGLNCVVSGFAFAAFIYSLAQQRRELRYQRHSMAESRTEMRLSIQAQVDSARALTIQITHMRLTATIDGLGALLRSFDAQIDFAITAIRDIEAEGGDVTALTIERAKLQDLKQSRDTTIAKLVDAINVTPQLGTS